MTGFDVCVVTHNDRNEAQAARLETMVAAHADRPYWWRQVSNRPVNRGYAAAANLAAAGGDEPLILFLNPDAEVTGPIFSPLADALADPSTVIAGEAFAKPAWEVRHWGLTAWVCGACLAVRRDWYEAAGGFDDRYRFGWEETDLCMRAQRAGLAVRPLRLPVAHTSPTLDTAADAAYKELHFGEGAALYARKWGRPPLPAPAHVRARLPEPRR